MDYTREKGVQSRPCPSCGEDRLAVREADGGTSFATCPCTTSGEQAPVQTPEKQVASLDSEVVIREPGTYVIDRKEDQ